MILVQEFSPREVSFGKTIYSEIHGFDKTTAVQRNLLQHSNPSVKWVSGAF